MLFFLSGALGLAYEILWLRKLLLIFGNTVYASSTVLTVFFGGLALGSWWGGKCCERHPDRGLLAYAWCEILIGAYALVTPLVFGLIERIYIPLYQASGLSPVVLLSASFVCTAAILLPPTVCLGATYPLLVRGLVPRGSSWGASAAWLYGLNTLGAMAGTACVYFIALQRLGWLASVQCAGLASLLVGIVARGLSRSMPPVTLAANPSAPADQPSRPPIRGLLVAFGLSGFAALVYEIAWTRSLSLIVGSSIYAFCLMLVTFLGGLALGGLLGRWWLARRPATGQQLVVLELGLALCGLGSIAAFQWVPEWFVRLIPRVGISFAGWTVAQGLLSIAVMLVPAIGFGLAFPLFLDLFAGHRPRWGERLGAAYAVNTIGGILGSFVCGFWLVPTVGLAWTIAIAGFANLVAALLMYVQLNIARVAVRWVMAGGLIAVWCGTAAWGVVPSWNRQVMSAGIYLTPSAYERGSVASLQQQYELLFYRESVHSTVSVHRNVENADDLFLKVGGKADASAGIDMGTQILLAQVPLLLRPEARDVLVIGLGSGVTAGSVARHPVSRIDVAEIEPAVIEASHYFDHVNGRPLEDPRVRVHLADGRNFLLASPQSYDLILSEPSNPWMAGIATLFTEEFYKQARRRLRPGGIMCQWFHVYRMFPADVKLVLRTFQQVFPYTSVWSSIPGDVLLVGSDQPYAVPYDIFRQRFMDPRVWNDVARLGLRHPHALLEQCWLGPEQVRRICADTRDVHRDDLPWLEFNAPKALYLADAFLTNYAGLRRFKTAPDAIVPDAPPAPQDAAYYAGLGEAYRFRGELVEAVDYWERARALDPSRVDEDDLDELYAAMSIDVEMADALRESIALNPRDVTLYQTLARLLWRQGKFAQAVEVYAQAAAVRPPSVELAREMGTLLLRMRRAAEASECFRSARSQDVTDQPALRMELVNSLKDLRRWEEAAQLLETALAQHPRDGSLLATLARVRLEQGRPDAAQALFERAVAAAPSSAEPYVGLGALAKQRGDLRKAEEWMMTGLRFDPYNVQALETLSQLQELPHG